MTCINIRQGLTFPEFINLVCRPHSISLSVRAPFDLRNDVNNKTLFIISLLVFRVILAGKQLDAQFLL